MFLNVLDYVESIKGNENSPLVVLMNCENILVHTKDLY